jgi:hypothetical protein
MRVDKRFLWQATRLVVLGLGAIVSLVSSRVPVPQVKAECPDDACITQGNSKTCTSDTGQAYTSCGFVGHTCTNGPPCPL